MTLTEGLLIFMFLVTFYLLVETMGRYQKQKDATNYAYRLLEEERKLTAYWKKQSEELK